MRTFVVAKEPYSRDSPEPLELFIVHAETLDDLAHHLDDNLCLDDVERGTAFFSLRESSGDGCDYYLIRELVNGKFLDGNILD